MSKITINGIDFNGDGITDDSIAIQKAINESYVAVESVTRRHDETDVELRKRISAVDALRYTTSGEVFRREYQNEWPNIWETAFEDEDIGPPSEVEKDFWDWVDGKTD